MGSYFWDFSSSFNGCSPNWIRFLLLFLKGMGGGGGRGNPWGEVTPEPNNKKGSAPLAQ